MQFHILHLPPSRPRGRAPPTVSFRATSILGIHKYHILLAKCLPLPPRAALLSPLKVLLIPLTFNYGTVLRREPLSRHPIACRNDEGWVWFPLLSRGVFPVFTPVFAPLRLLVEIGLRGIIIIIV